MWNSPAPVAPVGLRSRGVWLEARLREIEAATARYLAAGLRPADDWAREWYDHVSWLQSTGWLAPAAPDVEMSPEVAWLYRQTTLGVE